MLPAPQRRLWSALGDTPTDFVLYGGTALALRLGHRESVDFDFFSREPFAPEDLRKRIGYLNAARTLQQSENTLTCVVAREGDVHVSYLGGLDLCSVREPDRADGAGIFVASLLDLAATKVTTVQARADAKDYLEIDAARRGRHAGGRARSRRGGVWRWLQSAADAQGAHLFRGRRPGRRADRGPRPTRDRRRQRGPGTPPDVRAATLVEAHVA
ncbi:MAG: nucleotidyl transferase AbiEii/AbiGii toxin family protein [Gammaproteobacteria bacterium]|nr:nucleotidyl transferase AbiEii/AbiGii toxin family protein [Gammaproteobacteria bacterium]